MSGPSVSVLLPVYNSAAFLPAALDSILGQTFADFELIALDGGSTDGSVELLRAAAARDARVELVVEPGLPLIESLNLGLARARAPLDDPAGGRIHDDVVTPGSAADWLG